MHDQCLASDYSYSHKLHTSGLTGYMHTEYLNCWGKRSLYYKHSSQKGNVGGELVLETDHCIQSKTSGLTYILFFLLYLLYCTDVYQYILQALAHNADSEMLNPGGQVWFKSTVISNTIVSEGTEHGLLSACNKILTSWDSENTV